MIFLIFPNQLFYDIKHIDINSTIYLIEEPRYFTDFKFHKLKLAYHRATMKKYFDYIKTKFDKVKYIEFDKVNKTFYKKLNKVTFVDPCDNKLVNKLKKIIDCTIIDSPQFLLTPKEINENKLSFCKNNKYRNDDFYKMMRKKLDILMNKDKPIGGRWSFDTENRKSLPNKIDVPDLPKVTNSKYIKEAIIYVNKHFPDNYGLLENFIYPIDTNSSIDWLEDFLKNKLNEFGPYEDAVSTEHNFVFHSVLTPMMNIGLLLDKDVIEISYDYYKKHKVKLESFEGFIRQVIGWRTYVYSMYVLEGNNLYNSNILKHKRKVSDKWWLAKTNIEPIDFLINKIVNYSYVHHIERLMYLGNWLLLNQIHPKQVYEIFMEWTIDAYEWVMIPNVFGMSQFASDIMMTRPYFSSSNYILKMSNFKRGDWTVTWDAVYYSFINKHKKLLSSNYATAMQVKHWNNKKDNEKKEILKTASIYLKNH